MGVEYVFENQDFREEVYANKITRSKVHWMELADLITKSHPNVSYLDVMGMDWQDALLLIRRRMSDMQKKKQAE